MGLDMYFFTQPNSKNDEDRKELCYWRKHNRLHGWFADRWVKLHPRKNWDDFNCTELWLTVDMLDALEKDINERNLEVTHGFFFGGEYPYDDDQVDEDLTAIRKARKELKKGSSVCYYAWW